MTFAQIIAGADRRGDGFTVAVPAEWMQGRTTYGGLSAALAHEAARQVGAAEGGGELPPLRSALTSFIGPVAGIVEVTATVQRRGRNAIWVAARLVADGKLALTTSFVFMGPVESRLAISDAAPPADACTPEDAKPFPVHTAPAFLGTNFDIRFARPRPAQAEAEMTWWVRLNDRARLDPFTELMLVGDALPPTVLMLLGLRVPVSSMTWQANMLTAAPTTSDGWWLLRAVSDHAASGCSNQRMMLWNADRQPTAAGLQAMAIFG